MQEIAEIDRIDEPDTDLVADHPRGSGTYDDWNRTRIFDKRRPLYGASRIRPDPQGHLREVLSEISFGETKLGKELQKTVLEFLPRVPAPGPAALEAMLMAGIRKFYHIFPTRYHLLGLGMHPTLTLDRTAVWDHDEGEYYECYDRLFNIRQHGWLNIQALQINLSYAGEKDLLMQYNRIRTLLPYYRAHGVLSDGGRAPYREDGQPAHLLPGEPEGDPGNL